MSMEPNQELILDEADMAEYIQNKLLAQGYAVGIQEILLILGFEMDYMEENGFAIPIELEDEQ